MEFYRKILDWINEIKTDTKAHLQKQESLPELYCAKEECGKPIKGSQAFYQENSGSVYHLACGSIDNSKFINGNQARSLLKENKIKQPKKLEEIV